MHADSLVNFERVAVPCRRPFPVLLDKTTYPLKQGPMTCLCSLITSGVARHTLFRTGVLPRSLRTSRPADDSCYLPWSPPGPWHGAFDVIKSYTPSRRETPQSLCRGHLSLVMEAAHGLSMPCTHPWTGLVYATQDIDLENSYVATHLTHMHPPVTICLPRT